MRAFFIFVTLLAVLFLEWTLGGKFHIFGFMPSLPLVVLLIWFWFLNLESRLWVGAAVSIVLVSFSLYALSTYIAIVVIAAFMTEVFQNFFFLKVSR